MSDITKGHEALVLSAASNKINVRAKDSGSKFCISPLFIRVILRIWFNQLQMIAYLKVISKVFNMNSQQQSKIIQKCTAVNVTPTEKLYLKF